MGRDLQEPIGFLAKVYIGHFKINFFSTQNDHGALHPGSSNRTGKVIFFGHDLIFQCNVEAFELCNSALIVSQKWNNSAIMDLHGFAPPPAYRE